MQPRKKLGITLASTAALLLAATSAPAPTLAGPKHRSTGPLFSAGSADEACDPGAVDALPVECNGSAGFDLAVNGMSIQGFTVTSPADGGGVTTGKGWERASLQRSERFKAGNAVTYTVGYSIPDGAVSMSGAGTSADLYLVARATYLPTVGPAQEATVERILASSVVGPATADPAGTIVVTAPGGGAAGTYQLSLELVAAVNHGDVATAWAGEGAAAGTMRVTSLATVRS